MRPAAGLDRFQQPGKLLSQNADQQVVPTLVCSPHPPDVAIQIALLDEPASAACTWPGRAVVGHELHAARGHGQCRRHAEEPDPQRRQQRLGERPDIQHVTPAPVACSGVIGRPVKRNSES